MTRMTGSRGLRLLICVGCAASILQSGCGKGDRWWKKKKDPIVEESDEQSVDTSLTALAQDDEPIGTNVQQPEEFGSTRDQVLESARMMDEFFSGMEAGEDLDRAVVINEPAIEQPIESDPVQQDNPTTTNDGSFSLAQAAAERELEIDEPQADNDPAQETAQPVENVVVDAEQRKEELVAELVDVLTELARTSDQPGSAAAALAGMDSMSVEVLDGLHNEGVLSDAELSTLRAAREVLDSISSSGEIASPDQVAEVLDRIKENLDRASGIRVTRALLCTRVDGFGRYEPFASNEFVAGQAQEVIVYVEVDRFGHRALTGNDGQPRYEVEMSQRLELYHVADDLNTWNRAAEVDRSVSRNKVRDYYLINKITLPKNLGVGRYHLKVVMRDLVDEKIGEAIIPIRMVVR